MRIKPYTISIQEKPSDDQFSMIDSTIPRMVTSDTIVVQFVKNGRPQCYATPLSPPTITTSSTMSSNVNLPSTTTSTTIVTTNGSVMKGGSVRMSVNGANHLSNSNYNNNNNNNNELIPPALKLNDDETCI